MTWKRLALQTNFKGSFCIDAPAQAPVYGYVSVLPRRCCMTLSFHLKTLLHDSLGHLILGCSCINMCFLSLPLVE